MHPTFVCACVLGIFGVIVSSCVCGITGVVVCSTSNCTFVFVMVYVSICCIVGVVVSSASNFCVCLCFGYYWCDSV